MNTDTKGTISISKSSEPQDFPAPTDSQDIEMTVHSPEFTEILVEENKPPQDYENFWEEKKSKFVKLKLWEDERSNSYSVIQSARHRVLIENIFNRILNKAIIGREANLAAGRFLKDRAMADLAYANSLKAQLVYLPSSNHQSSVGSLKHGLAAISNLQSELANRLKEFCNRIEK
jgi:hypothetical protein